MMNKQTTTIAGRACTLCRVGRPEWLLLQPVDDHDLERLDSQLADMAAAQSDFLLVAFKIDDWMDELTPWPAPPTYGRQPFGDGAPRTLSYVLGALLPALEQQEQRQWMASRCLIGGYSLAGFFALWATTQTARFGGVAGVSASVWYPRWLDDVAVHPLQASHVYLSIGDKERRARNALMASNQTCMEQLLARLQQQGTHATLELNPGNHFQDNDHRMARGFVWLME